jgi:shikimate kinase
MQPDIPGKVMLIGMMGAGKTTIGREAARRTGRTFVDVDAVIEEEHGIAIAEMFRRDGEELFRRRECAAIESILDRPGPAIIAAGGGAFCQEAVRRCLAGRAVSVFLRVEEDELVRRLAMSDAALRPVLGGDGWRDRVGDLVRRRYPLYELADKVLSIGEETPETTCQRLLELLTIPTPEKKLCRP